MFLGLRIAGQRSNFFCHGAFQQCRGRRAIRFYRAAQPPVRRHIRIRQPGVIVHRCKRDQQAHAAFRKVFHNRVDIGGGDSDWRRRHCCVWRHQGGGKFPHGRKHRFQRILSHLNAAKFKQCSDSADGGRSCAPERKARSSFDTLTT